MISMTSSALSPGDQQRLADWRAKLDALGPAIDIGGLCRFLRSHNHTISVAQEIRASVLVAKLAREGAVIDSAAAATHWFAPILSITRGDQRISFFRARRPPNGFLKSALRGNLLKSSEIK